MKFAGSFAIHFLAPHSMRPLFLCNLLGRLGRSHGVGRRHWSGVVWRGAARSGEWQRICHFRSWGVKLTTNPHPQSQRQADDHTHKPSLQNKPWQWGPSWMYDFFLVFIHYSGDRIYSLLSLMCGIAFLIGKDQEVAHWSCQIWTELPEYKNIYNVKQLVILNITT